MHVVHLCNAVDMQCVAPDGVLTYVRLDIWLVGLVREGYHLTLLREFIVAISILQSIDAIFTISNALDDEMSIGIGSCYTQ